MSSETSTDVIGLQVSAGVSTSRIYATTILADEDTMILPQDISNMKKTSRTKLLATQTSNEALFSLLTKHKFYHKFEVEESTNRLRYLMWAHPASTKLARDFMGILVIDCTYKTNKYRMPVLNAITLTGMNTVLPVAQIWIPGEAEPDFLWALRNLKTYFEEQSIPMPALLVSDRDLACLNASDQVFPTANKLLCRWHIRRNVLAHAQRKIVVTDTRGSSPAVLKSIKNLQVDIFMARFDATINSATESEFDQGCRQLKGLSAEMDTYLKRTWWPYKTKFVRCWTNAFLHYGCHDTSTVEGTHAKMKSFLDNSQGDLLNVFQRLLPWWTKTSTSNSVQAEREMSYIPQRFREDIYSGVVKIISVHALNETHKLWNAARKIVVHQVERSQCDGVFRRTHGRPCIHDLVAVIESNGRKVLQPKDFDNHWWLPVHPSVITARVVGPAPLSKRRRMRDRSRSHTSGHGINSTRRDPSGFELMEQEEFTSTPATRTLSFQELLQQHDDDFQQDLLPPRSWGFAGLRELLD